MTRSRRLIACLLLAGWLLPGAARAEFVFDAYVPLQPDVERAIERAQRWLAATQQKNGSWGTCNGTNAMATMALMINGTTPGHGRHGLEVARALDFLVSTQQANGVVVAGGGGNMYQHAMATLCLAEGYGMSHNLALRGALIKAIDLIVTAQNRTGGWRYAPTSTDADLSVTVMQVMALRAAVDAGIAVPRESIDLAIKYVKGNWNPTSGSFGLKEPVSCFTGTLDQMCLGRM